MPVAFALCMQDLGRWREGSRAVETPGGELPYGLGRLREWFDLEWDDRDRRGLWATKPARLTGGLVRRQAPGLAGAASIWTGRSGLRRADVTVSLFENAGLGLGRLQSTWKRRSGSPHVMVVCWLAEDCAHMSRRELRSVGRSLPSVGRLLVFSRNQVAVLTDTFSLPEDKVVVVPFGVDTDYYSPESVNPMPSGGGGLVAVGSDSRRDYATLFAAVRRAGVSLTLACLPRNLVGLDVPSNVTLVSAFNDGYRRLLHSADLVVTPTIAPAYPSGQSVVLEAMAMARATLTTDSVAMRDYVRDGVDGVLVAPRDSELLAARITSLLADAEQRKSLGLAGRARVVGNFSLDSMWQAIAGVMRAQASDRSSSGATGRRRSPT